MIFKVKRIMQYSEIAEIEANDYEQLDLILNSEDIEFKRNEDDIFYDQEIEILEE